MIKLYPNQVKLVDQVKNLFKTHKKVLLGSSCSSGKTVMGIALIEYLVRQKKRIAISTYSKLDIRDNWLVELKDKAPHLFQHIQVVCKKQDVSQKWELGIPAVSNGDVSKTKLITIFIPQSISNNMGMFDYFFIDEAHEFLDVNRSEKGFKGGKLTKIIRTHTHKDSRILGITATGFDLLRKGSYFEGAGRVIYDVPDAFRDKVINDCEISLEYFEFGLSSNLYDDKGSLNVRGRKFVNTQFKRRINFAKLEKVIRMVNGGKTLVIVPGGTDKRGAGQETQIKDYINKYFRKTVAVEKSCRNSKEQQQENEKLFREDPNIRFLVVINMCGTGWNFPQLNSVIDLTFTKSPKLIIHRLSRTIRKDKDKPRSKYIYCADQLKSPAEVMFYVCRAIELTTREGILAYDGKVWSNFLNNRVKEKKGEKVLALKSLSLKGYTDYALKAIRGMKNKNIFRKNLQDIRSKSKTIIDPALAPFFLSLIENRKSIRGAESIIHQITVVLEQIRQGSKNDIAYVQEAMHYLKKHFPKEFTRAYCIRHES